MAASPTPRSAEPPATVAVACSGGRDSTALLHATARAAAALGGVQVVALHVHHGLLAQADDWVRHLQRQVERWAVHGLPVAFDWQRLAGQPAPGDSVEAWARQGRYEALARMAQRHGASLVLLAHHRGDQAETFLLQALRGAGPAGLAGMAVLRQAGAITWARPWLAQPPRALAGYVQRHRLSVVSDPSNADPRFARSRLRAQVMPVLAAAFPDAETALASSALRAQEAAACLAELAMLDARQHVAADGSLLVAPWLDLSAPRRANALRAWLRGQRPGAGRETLVQRLMLELPSRAVGNWPAAPGILRLYRGHLRHIAHEAPVPTPVQPLVMDLSQPGCYALPGWPGQLLVQATATGGIAAQALRQAHICARSAGMQFQAAPQRPARALKKQYQDAGVPHWQRAGPVVCVAGAVAFVAGLGIDARVIAGTGQPQHRLSWLPAGEGVPTHAALQQPAARIRG